ncbi:MAG: hypothetical protein LQ350_004359 [Teloschistes chrysophthalmus]|nr:MAG: hypothetical protein LQ350_004359 [Niorma chrysophthalma]
MSPIETGITAEATTASPDSSSKQTVICVFCGASPGNNPVHLEVARSLGKVLHEGNIKLIYGGGSAGIMGEVARTVVSLSGRDAVLGIIPKPLLEYEREQSGITPDPEVFGNLEIVGSMHARKDMMTAEVMKGGPGSGFIALSGGYGSLEELMEMTTWNTLGIHDKGIVALNVDGYYDALMDWKKHAVEAGFLGKKNENVLVEAKDAEGAVKALKEYKLSEGRLKLDWSEK